MILLATTLSHRAANFIEALKSSTDHHLLLCAPCLDGRDLVRGRNNVSPTFYQLTPLSPQPTVHLKDKLRKLSRSSRPTDH